MTTKEKLLNTGLLILRVGIGISIFFHGLPKIMGGVETWTAIGSSLSAFGIDFAPTFWGLLAALTESVGGILFALGLLFRPATVFLSGMMVIALGTHLMAGDGFMTYGHSLDLLIVFVASFFTGAGKLSLDHRFFKKIA